MTEEQVEQRLSELEAPFSYDQVALILKLLKEQQEAIDLIIWNFREFKADKIASSYAAINHLWKAIRDKNFPERRKRPKIAYIAHAVGGDIEANLADLRRIVAFINQGSPVVPFVPYYADVVSIGESPAMRKRGIENDTAILKSGVVDEIWLTGTRISEGMKAEMELAEKLGIPVVNLLNTF